MMFHMLLDFGLGVLIGAAIPFAAAGVLIGAAIPFAAAIVFAILLFISWTDSGSH